jgi:hypothetical protein
LLAATGADFTKQPEKAHAQDENDKKDPEGEKEIRAWKLRQSLLALSMGNEAVKTRATKENPGGYAATKAGSISRKDAKAAKEERFPTWRSWRLGARKSGISN